MFASRLASLCVLVLIGAGVGACDTGSSDSTAGRAGADSGDDGAAGSEVDWPLFGRVLERTHHIADAPNPPLRYRWEFFAKQLIEFPPVLENGHVYVVNKTGELFAVRASDGKLDWSRNLGNDVTGPAYADGIVYLAQFDGTLTAVDTERRRVAWTYNAPSHLESSPLIAEGRLFIGSDDGTVFAFDAKTGKLDWRADVGHDVKASPSYHDGRVLIGDYEGSVNALEADSGKVAWTADTTKMPPGGGGGFYSSPSIAFGRVYEARDDGTVYAFDLESGKLDWHFVTSNAIYGSPAVAQVPRLGPTVYIGSYNHQLYALNAESGAKRWTYDVGGQVPGTPTIIGDTVYTSSFQTKKTVGLDARTGKPVFRWGSAGYTPMISDGEQNYLSGFQTIWAFTAKEPGG